jgi:uncharacterized protein (TIGR03437 family)
MSLHKQNYRSHALAGAIGCGLIGALAAAGADTAGSLRVVNAASYVSQIAPGGAAAAFSVGLPTDSSTTVNVCQPGNPPINCAQGTIYLASPTQINFRVPTSTPVGPLPNSVVVQVLQAGTVVASGTVAVTAYSPGIFTANATGGGLFAGQTFLQNQYDIIYTYGSNVILPSGASVPSIIAKPISPASGTVIFYGTGWAGVPLHDIQVTIDGTSVAPEYAGPTVDPGLDQLNIHVPDAVVGQTSHLADVTITIAHAPGSPTGVFSTNRVQLCVAGQDGSSNCPAPELVPPALCTDPLSGLTAPYAPHGIFVLQFPGAAPVSQSIRKQSTVCGGNIFVVWSQVDSGGGNYDWSSVDNQIAPWVAAGKSVNLIVWGVNQQIPNTATPAYVQQDPTYQSVSCVTRGTNATYPVYYSPGYEINYQKFMSAVLNQYGTNPNVGYIRFGLARGGEAFPTCMTEMMQLAGQTSTDQFDTVWKKYITDMTAFQKNIQAQILSANGHVVQLMGALNQYGSSANSNVTDFEASNAASLGFGFGSQGLSLADLNHYNSGSPCTSDWCKNFVALAGLAVPLELQPIAATDPTNAPRGTGSLTELLPFGLSLHAQIFELYIEDLQVAYDPNSRYYAQYSQSYQQALRLAAAVVGGRP